MNWKRASGDKLLLVLIFCLTAVACTQSPVRPNHIDTPALNSIESMAVRVDMISEDFNVDYQANELNLSIPVAAVTAAQIAAMNSNREAAAAGGIIGTFIGIQIARSAYQAKLQDEANSDVQPLKQTLDTSDFAEHVSRQFAEAMQHALQPRFRTTAAEVDALLAVKLGISLNVDLSTLHLRAEATANANNEAQRNIYSREIDYYDLPMASATDTSREARAEKWMANEGELFEARLQQSLNALAAILAKDLERDAHLPIGGGKAIRYRNLRGTFYERGEIVSASSDRILIRTLRGGLVSVSGVLQEDQDQISP